MPDYFIPSEHYFCIDAANARDAVPRLYGYALLGSRLIDENSYTPADADLLDGTGMYVCVQKTDTELIIRQDFNGSYGLFVYRDGDTWAIGNSYQYVVDHVRGRHPLTMDRDCLLHMFGMVVCSMSFGRTPMTEITRLPRDSAVHIDLTSGTLSFSRIDYAEGTVPLDSDEAAHIADAWLDRWTALYRALYAQTHNITAALSGGFDSRMSFMTVLVSGIDLNGIRVRSFDDGLHTHSEDYVIASEIAARFGFELNRDPFTGPVLHHSQRDIVNMIAYGKLPFHKEMYYRTELYPNRAFLIPGAGGECLRGCYRGPSEALYGMFSAPCDNYDAPLADELKRAVTSIMDDASAAVRERYGLAAGDPEAGPAIFRDVRCRNHSGTMQVDDFHAGIYNLSPLLDPMLYRLQIDTPECPERKLLFAFLFARYCPALLDFRFNAGWTFDPAVIDYANRLNARHPRRPTDVPPVTVDLPAISVPEGDDNPPLSAADMDRFLMRVTDSTACRKLFGTAFDTRLYDFARYRTEVSAFYPLRYVNTVLSAVQTLQDLDFNRRALAGEAPEERAPYEMLSAFAADGTAYKNEYAVLKRLAPFIACRADITVSGGSAPRIELTDCSDPGVLCSRPAFLQKDGSGLMLTSDSGALDAKLHVTDGTRLQIAVRGMNVPDGNGGRVPYRQQLECVELNGEPQPGVPVRVWHDRPLRLRCDVRPGDTLTLRLRWTPCRYKAPADAAAARIRQVGRKVKKKLERIRKKG